jgi:hypothetical protein
MIDPFTACDPKPGLMVKQIFFQATENSWNQSNAIQ